MNELQKITVSFTMVTRNDPDTVLDGVREQLEPLRKLIVDSKVTRGEALPADVPVPAEVVDEAVEYLEEWAHENCGPDDPCPGSTRKRNEETAKGLLARALPTYRAILTAEVGTIDIDRPRIVVLCGSTRFRDEFRAQERRLSLEGVIATGPGTFGHCGDPITEDDKTRLDELHRRKIELADEVFVINPRTPDHPDGYIGDSTRSEIAYAETLGKPISYLVEVDHG